MAASPMTAPGRWSPTSSFRNTEVDPWYAIRGSPKIPATLAEQYRTAIIAALEDAAVRESLVKQRQIIKWGTPAELLALARAVPALWARVVRQI